MTQKGDRSESGHRRKVLPRLPRPPVKEAAKTVRGIKWHTSSFDMQLDGKKVCSIASQLQRFISDVEN